MDGKTYGLEGFAGKPVLVVIFSCNHCPYVQAYEDCLIGLQRDYGNRGVQLVAINSNDDVRYTGKIDDNWQRPEAVTRRYLRDAVDALLAQREPADPITHAIGCTSKWAT